jgi:hypothetical protein
MKLKILNETALALSPLESSNASLPSLDFNITILAVNNQTFNLTKAFTYDLSSPWYLSLEPAIFSKVNDSLCSALSLVSNTNKSL